MEHPARTNETEAQAAEWLIRLEDKSSAATLAQWRRWLSQDARRHAAYVRLENGWRQTDSLKRLRPLDGAIDVDVLSQFPGLEPTRKPTRPAYRPSIAHWAITAAVALAAVLVYAWL